ncbi:MAG TPA: EVE domain-containing protein [Flavobacterium sp.]|nr:EVE domain-containing protein [Flavobacterium sp.]
MSQTRYWIAAVSREHAMRGIAGSFTQVCHGKEAPLKRMKKGDYLIVYSSKITMEGNEKCQAFTAIGQVEDDEIYQFQMTESFNPYRRNINFLNCRETPILPLIVQLEFIQNKTAWGYPFRFGFFEIQKKDFKLISSKMLGNER